MALLTAPAPALAERCFEITGYCISGPIHTYWERNSGLAVHEAVRLGSEVYQALRAVLVEQSNFGGGVGIARLREQCHHEKGRHAANVALLVCRSGACYDTHSSMQSNIPPGDLRLH